MYTFNQCESVSQGKRCEMKRGHAGWHMWVDPEDYKKHLEWPPVLRTESNNEMETPESYDDPYYDTLPDKPRSEAPTSPSEGLRATPTAWPHIGWLPDWSWQVWTILFLIVVIILILEGAYRMVRRHDEENIHKIASAVAETLKHPCSSGGQDGTDGTYGGGGGGGGGGAGAPGGRGGDVVIHSDSPMSDTNEA